VSDDAPEELVVAALVVEELVVAAVVTPAARSAMFAPRPTKAERLSAAATARDRCAAWRRRTAARRTGGSGPEHPGSGRSRSGRGGVCRISITCLLGSNATIDRAETRVAH
jgi:hypothetical protein